MEELEMLGVAERGIVDQFMTAISNCIKTSTEIAERFRNVSEEGLAKVMLDSTKKESIVKLLPTLQQMDKNLGMSVLLPMMLDILSNPKDKDDN